MDLKEKMKIIESVSDGGSTFEVLEFDNLDGASDPAMAMALYFAKQSGLRSRIVRVKLNNSSVKTEAGALYYSKGNLVSDAKMGGVGGFFKKGISGALTSESLVKPSYKGTGEIYLEPSFKHYYIMELKNETIIIDKGVFYCCSDSLELKAVSQKNVSSAILGGDGIFQLRVSGTGVLILELSVPKNEIVEYELNGSEELKVDGDFSFARTASVNFSVTKSQKSLFKSAMSGEGFLNTYSGKGKVWLAPTSSIYREFGYGFMPGNSGMDNNEID